MDRPSGGSGDLAPPKGSRSEPELEEAYERLVYQGRERLDRPLLPLLSTGLLGGVDVGVGVLIYLVVQAETDNHVLASLAFSIGVVALLLAKSELSTENFLVPVTAVIAKTGTLAQLVRLWVVTLAANLVGGFAMAAMAATVVIAIPDVHHAAVEAGSHYAHLGVSWRSFFLAVLAGTVITLLTRMQHATGLRLLRVPHRVAESREQAG